MIYIANRHGHREFYEDSLVAGVHYLHVNRASDVPAAVDMLRRNDAWAVSIGEAGQRQIARMDEASVESYVFTLLRSYSTLQRFTPRAGASAVRVNCEDDVYRLVRLDYGRANFTSAEDHSLACIEPAIGNLVSVGGRWATQAGYVNRLGYPRFFMPAEESDAKAAEKASKALAARVLAACKRAKLEPVKKHQITSTEECREANVILGTGDPGERVLCEGGRF